MCENLIESAERSDQHCIKAATYNISLKDIKTPPNHLSDGKADTNYAVEESNFP